MSKSLMRFLVLSSICVIISAELFAQQPVFRSQNANLNTFSAPTKAKSFVPAQDTQSQAPKKRIAPAGVNIHLMPLFGEYEKTETQKAADEEFLKMCDLNFPSRAKASAFFAERAWEYLEEGQKDTATYRFNLAYLLDNENTDAFWGLGVISYQNEDYAKAISLMKRGIELDDDDNQTLAVDLSTVYIKCFTVDAEKDDLYKAFDLLEKVIKKQPESANAYMQLSLARLLNSQLDDAWETFHKGYEIDPDNASVEILEGLLAKKADPKGIFKKKD